MELGGRVHLCQIRGKRNQNHNALVKCTIVKLSMVNLHFFTVSLRFIIFIIDFSVVWMYYVL